MGEAELPVPQLADDAVALRPWAPADVPGMLTAFTDPWFQRFSDWAPMTPDEARAYQRRREDDRMRGTDLDLAVVDVAHREVVLGGISLNGVDMSLGRASIGYWLAPVVFGLLPGDMSSAVVKRP